MSKYKKFIVFQYEDYYPGGGLGDIQASFDTIEECTAYIAEHYYDNNEIVDRDTWEIVLEGLPTEVMKGGLKYKEKPIAFKPPSDDPSSSTEV